MKPFVIPRHWYAQHQKYIPKGTENTVLAGFAKASLVFSFAACLDSHFVTKPFACVKAFKDSESDIRSRPASTVKEPLWEVEFCDLKSNKNKQRNTDSIHVIWVGVTLPGVGGDDNERKWGPFGAKLEAGYGMNPYADCTQVLIH